MNTVHKLRWGGGVGILMALFLAAFLGAPAMAFAQFTDIGAGLTGVSSGSAVWGDYDNDGDLDILLAGLSYPSSMIAEVYRNDNGIFNDIGAGLTGVWYAPVAWGDYDSDGDLDILLTGRTAGGSDIAKVYQNTGSGFTDIGANLSGMYWGSSAWGDYDNDGDLDILLTGSSAGVMTAKVYRNDGGTFTFVAGLTGVWHSSVAWGDYDSDGDLDILLTGESSSGYIAKVYQNTNGVFTDIGASLTGVHYSSVAWGDYDNDGDLDIVLTGRDAGSSRIAKVYQNTGGTFADIGAGLTGVAFSSVAWGDYDNDGDLDILLTGGPSSGYIAKVYQNTNGVFTDIGAGLTGVTGSSAAWGDYDNDGDLDILLTGLVAGNNIIAKIYRNDGSIFNTMPSAPGNLSAAVSVNTATLSWDASSDTQTPSAGLTYNLMVGTTSNGVNINSPMADVSTGYRRVVQLGGTNHNRSWALKNLPDGNYFWRVQAVDAAFAGSPFSAEGTFSLAPEMDVQSNNISIANNDVTPSVEDGTDFGSFTLGSPAVNHIFTIRNTGGAPLNLIGNPTAYITASEGENSEGFLVTVPPISPVPAGGEVTFTVQFQPLWTTGLRSATVEIPNNDADENPYRFKVQGVATGTPDMEVRRVFDQYSYIVINDGDNTPYSDDFTNFGSAQVGSAPVDHTFTIANTGTGSLNLTGGPPRVSVSGSGFSLLTDASTPVGANGGTTTFTVRFTPSTLGLSTGTVSIANDDADENPYDFAIQGIGMDYEPWSEIVKLQSDDKEAGDRFGRSVSMSRNRAVVGAPYEDTQASDAGAAYILEREGTGPWHQVAKLLAGDGAASDRFGYAVSISGDRVIVGAYGHDAGASNAGAAYVFERNGSGAWTQVVKLMASDPAEYDEFGWSVSINGDRAIVGADSKDDGAGAAYVFERDGAGAWTQVAKLLAGDREAGDAFGYSVSINRDRAVVGAEAEDTGGEDAGAAYIFERDGAGAWNQVVKLLANDIAANDEFGFSVSLEGDRTIVGADEKAAGDEDEAGAAYIFERNGSGIWSQTAKLQASDASYDAAVGNSVSLSGDRAIVGAFSRDNGGYDVGAAYVFELDGGVWSEVAKLLASDREEADRLGYSVSISGDCAIVGAPYEDSGGTDVGAVYFFKEGASEIDVAGGTPSVSIADGDNTPSVDDGTDFGSLDVGAGSVNHTFTITSSAQACLDLTDNPPRIAITGSGFSLVSDASARVARRNGTTTFTIRFAPTVPGSISGTVSIANDDADENPYNFAIQGVGRSLVVLNDFVFVATDTISFERFSPSRGNSYCNGAIIFERGKPSTYNGDLTSVGDITIKQRNTINGNVTSGGMVTRQTGATVNGTVTEHAAVGPAVLPVLSFTAGTTNISVPARGSRTLAPGSYGNVSLASRATLSLSNGDYYFQRLVLAGSATLSVNVTNGPVNIHIVGPVLFSSKAIVKIVPSGESGTQDVDFYVLGEDPLFFDIGSRLLGSVTAPNAVVLLDGSRFRGSMAAKKIWVDANTVFLHHSSSGILPKLEGDDQAIVDVTAYDLFPNYPNPFNPETTIGYALLHDADVTLKVFDILGREVSTLVNERQPTGFYRVTFTTDGLASGVYFYSINAREESGGTFTQVKRMMLLK